MGLKLSLDLITSAWARYSGPIILRNTVAQKQIQQIHENESIRKTFPKYQHFIIEVQSTVAVHYIRGRNLNSQ